MTLHTFGCSITQGFALPDVVRPMVDSLGRPLTLEQMQEFADRFHWTDVHLYAPSKYAWPQVLADRLGIPVNNHARRGSCFQQISRQLAANVDSIKPGDIVIVMWTYLSRISLCWPARTSVPLASIVDTGQSWRTRILPGFNSLFGLEPSPNRDRKRADDELIHRYIHDATFALMDPMGVYDRYYNNLVLQTMTDGFLRATGARVIHLSVETETSLEQLEQARLLLDPSLREPYQIPDPNRWYTISVDHTSCRVIHDPSIPPAANDTHPSELHHSNFASHIYDEYFK